LTASSTIRVSQPEARIRVLIVDDSTVVRSMMRRWLGEESDVEIVGMAIDGVDGIAQAKAAKPDVVVLDVEMPNKDGLTALPDIIEAAPGVRVLMASTLTQRAARITLDALTAGASDYLAKPENARLSSADDYRRELTSKIRALGASAVRRRVGAGALTAERDPFMRIAVQSPFANRASPASAQAAVAQPTAYPARSLKPFAPKALLIGSSTGGPEALRKVIAGLAGKVRVPIFITQHMPPHFTKILAEHLDRIHPGGACEAEDGMPVRPGAIYLAPGDFHMTVRQRGATIVTQIDQKPQVNFCRPAVDPLFESAVSVFGGDVLAVVLTGMGHDGAKGAVAIQQAGGRVIAQDEPSSVVWGMPGAVVKAGAAHRTVALEAIAKTIIEQLEGRG
jgi:two-component system, chemotaxis family, protein-glutamate methylesterase/glutaminase